MKNSFNNFYKGLHQLLNHILIVGLCFQILIFFIEINDYEITVPKFLLTKFDNILSENNLSYEATSIKLKLTGEINCENLKLKNNNFLEPIATCDHLSLNLSLFALLFERFNLEEILIRNATLFCPPSLTPTGLNEPLIKNLFGALSLTRKYFQLQQLDFDFQNIAVIAEGAWRKKSFAKNPFDSNIPQKSIKQLMSDYLSIAQLLIQMKDKFSIFLKPVLTINLSEKDPHSLLLNLQMNASGCEFNNLSSGPINIKSKLQYRRKTLNTIAPIEISAQNINWNNKLSTHSLQLQSFIELNDLHPLIKDIKASLNNVTYQNTTFDSLELSCNLSNLSTIPGHLALIQNTNWLYAKGLFNTDTKKIQADIKGNALLQEIKKITSEFLKEEIFENQINGNINWIGKLIAQLNDKLTIENSELTVASQNFSFDNVHLDKLYAELQVNPEQLNINYINANLGNNHAKGSIYHNFQTQDYRYLVSGTFKPDLLNPYLDSWWQELMSKFQFSNTSPFGNIDIQGNALITNEWFVFGEFLGTNFIYNKLPVKELSLRIHSNQNELELIDLDANSNTGKLETYAKFLYGFLPNKNEEEIVSTYVKGTSSLALNELDQILELPDIHNIIKDFNTEISPTIFTKGTISEKNPDESYLKIFFSQNTPLIYHQIPFGHMNFDVDYTPKEIAVNNLNVEFASGVGQGDLKITPTSANTPPEITANISFLGVKQEIAVDYLKKLWLPQNNTKANNYGGLLTLNLNATGILGDWLSFMGSGKISITQANLARINLFGILSQILSFTPLNLGSFHLTDATSDFYIQKNVLHFPNIHIFGSTGSIDANGNLYLENQELAFMLNISPVNKKGIPIISQVMLVLAPLTQSFQMKLGGTLQNPKWETLLTPLGLGKEKGPELPQN
ncbi:MAG: hypothetical protein C5B43_02470 [Verrucomicrobia bacterium]|nr:MAG: hypothetical protein C5B43_02470 [Verrucomicrobiota bacterium]